MTSFVTPRAFGPLAAPRLPREHDPDAETVRVDMIPVGYPQLRLFATGVLLGFLVGAFFSVAQPARSLQASFTTRAGIRVVARVALQKTVSGISWIGDHIATRVGARFGTTDRPAL